MQTITKVGKHKIPRFIYHMTTKSNYESILKDGMIKTSSEGLIGNGIFTTELTNFFKHWRKNSSWGNSSLQEQLLLHVSKGEDEIIILKIPTAKLSPDKLVIRSQNKLFSWLNSNNADKIFEAVENFVNQQNGTLDWLNRIRNLYKKLLLKKESRYLTEHLTTGAPAKMSGLYKQRKEALEYIYLDNIPISDAKKIGEVDIKALRKTAEYDPVRPMRSIFTNLLKGTPEAKGAELLSC